MDIRDNGISEFVMNCISFDYMIFAVSGKFPDNTAEELRAKQDGMQIWFKESFLKSNKLSGPSHILVLNDKDPDYNPSASSASADISLKEKNDPSLPAAAKKSNSNTLETDESKILKQMNKNPKAEENKNIEESKKQDLEKPAAAMALLMKKYDIFREENAENIRLNFRLHNSSVISAVFPKTFKLEVTILIVILKF
jgi:hypothetical protein